jgi:hypothetical protein
MSTSPFDIFDGGPSAASPPADESEPPRAVATEAHAKLRQNLDLALQRHKEMLSQRITEETDIRNKRLVAEVATATVKAALATDRTALKARSDNIIARVLLRAIFTRLTMGLPVREEDLARLKAASRKEIEASLWPKQLEEYDRMKNAGW